MSASAVPTMSTIESTAPISWKVTLSTSLRCTIASASASRRKIRCAISFASSGSSAASSNARMLAYVRMTPVAFARTTSLKCAQAVRFHLLDVDLERLERQPGQPFLQIDSKSAPASINAAERHVSGDTCDAIEIGEAHR